MFIGFYSLFQRLNFAFLKHNRKNKQQQNNLMFNSEQWLF